MPHLITCLKKINNVLSQKMNQIYKVTHTWKNFANYLIGRQITQAYRYRDEYFLVAVPGKNRYRMYIKTLILFFLVIHQSLFKQFMFHCID